MKEYKCPQFKSDNSIIELIDLLKFIPENTWIWSVLEYYGQGIAPANLSIQDFEDIARNRETGFILTRKELWKFAETSRNVIDCCIVGVSSFSDLDPSAFAMSDFSKCNIVLEVFDSSFWVVKTPDSLLISTLQMAFT
ncbi:hypothetical protein ACE5IS_19695 [Leptospira wolffii]|uniref:Uncharacterized protein n=1 Tax=Leptospira wolffii TaxID=409998 RepID=A0ABV5BXC1_9LEPT